MKDLLDGLKIKATLAKILDYRNKQICQMPSTRETHTLQINGGEIDCNKEAWRAAEGC
jgi:hypothetical protein